MLISYNANEYNKQRASLVKKDPDMYIEFVRVSRCIARYWTAHLSGSALKTVLFLVGRTLSFGKRAEVIPRAAFVNGIVDVCEGSGVSQRTLDAVMKELQEHNLVNVHAFAKGNVESLHRIYEINVEAFFEKVPEAMLRTWKKAENTAKQPPAKSALPPLQSLRDLSNTYRSNGDTNVSPPDRSAPGLSSPRKPRPQSKVDVNIKRSAAEIAAGLQANSQATRDTRVATSRDPAGKPWSKQQLQALLDKAHATVRDEGYATQRIVAIDKGRKLLQQRMTDRGIKDALEFFEYVLRNWSTIAAAHSNATKRKRTEGQDLGRSIHRSPNFDDLYQRLPYIATIFLNDEFRTAEAQIERDREEEKKRQGAQERQEAQRTRRQIARQRDLEREEQRKREEQALASRVERTRTSPRRVADDLPEMPTSFEEWQARRKNAK